MNANQDLSTPDFDDEDSAIQARRLKTYSTRALSIAMPAARVFVAHPAFSAAVVGLDRIYQLAGNSSVPQGGLLIGETGTGKTSLLRYYRDSMPTDLCSEVGSTVLYIRLQDQPNVGRIVSSLLRQLNYAFSQVRAETVGLKKDILIDGLRQKGSRLLFVDEAHTLLHSTRRRAVNSDGNEVTEALREFMDESGIGLVLSGSPMLDQIAECDRHLAARLPTRFELRNFTELPQFLAFVRAFSSRFPAIDLSELAQADVARRWLQACDGNPRQVKQMVLEAILVAIDAGKPAVDRDVLAAAFPRLAGHGSLRANPFL